MINSHKQKIMLEAMLNEARQIFFGQSLIFLCSTCDFWKCKILVKYVE
jgi:hypothetical protein